MYQLSSEKLRNTLPAFSKVTGWRPNDVWDDYAKLYKLIPLREQYDWTVGVEPYQDLSLVMQHFAVEDAVGTVFLLHGYTDHLGLYTGLIETLLKAGWNVLGVDLPGHGLSSGNSYSIQSFSTYAGMVQHILKTHCQNEMTLLMGLSTGGAAILEHQRLYPAQAGDPFSVAGRILLAPLVRPAYCEVIQWKYRLLHLFLKRVKRVRTEHSHDEAFLRFIHEEDPLQSNWIAVDWIGAMLKWIPLIEGSVPSKIPMTVIQGTDDTTVDWSHNVTVLKQLYPSAEIKLIEGARHHLVNEGEPWLSEIREVVLQTLSKIKARAAEPPL